ncbi:Sel1-like repeat-containing protein [Megavirus baoshan]|uniref:Sel1-like repeat-containing protein n=1 Tax=Megavirus baoshan TaxID=2496520 RepID=A0A3Q8U8E9_9VIRU|nr:Sel1-like repeat-containing protein [Megavirus baoshan]AZL89673.1 Sel1-like repeat-containing protein [Megavirus baoshan]
MHNHCDHCGSIIYSETYHKCIEVPKKINDEIKTIDYKLITIDELGILADNNDRGAQDEIVFRYLNQGAIYLSQKNIKPINWQNIIERAIDNQYFMHFLLYFEYNAYDAIFNVLFENVKSAAKNGDSMAQCNLGKMYHESFGVKKNILKAIKWITKSADQNNKYGLMNLARFYEDGDGVLLDINKAIKLYERAACQNLSSTQYCLGRLYENQCPPNRVLALKYYQQAANQNHSYAQYCLAICYNYSRGVTLDYQMAIHWLTLAIDQGLNSAKNELANMYMKGLGVKKNYHKAIELLNSSIYDDGTDDIDDFNAMSKLASMYKYGRGVEKDINRAIYLYLKSKKLHKIKRIFKTNTITFINPINVDCENDNVIDIDQLESKIIYKIQSMMIKLKYEQTNIYHIDIENSLQETENKFVKLVKLRTQINNSSAMITCLTLNKNIYLKPVDDKKNLYFNIYNLDDLSYLNFGTKNTKLVNNIFKKLDKYKSNMLLDLKIILENKYKEKVNDLLNAVKHEDHHHQLNIVKYLENIIFFQSRVEKISSKLLIYFSRLIEDIKSNTHIRNQQFQCEYSFIF